MIAFWAAGMERCVNVGGIVDVYALVVFVLIPLSLYSWLVFHANLQSLSCN